MSYKLKGYHFDDKHGQWLAENIEEKDVAYDIAYDYVESGKWYIVDLYDTMSVESTEFPFDTIKSVDLGEVVVTHSRMFTIFDMIFVDVYERNSQKMFDDMRMWFEAHKDD